jgi:hypothetical protein
MKQERSAGAKNRSGGGDAIGWVFEILTLEVIRALKIRGPKN